jgi:hypothetical protein
MTISRVVLIMVAAFVVLFILGLLFLAVGNG